MKAYTLIAALLIGMSSTFAQSETIENFKEQNADGKSWFAYQSVLRMLNTENDDNYNMLIRDLEYINVIISDSLGTSQKDSYRSLIKGIESEGFEEIAMMDNKDRKGAIYEKENGSHSTWVAFMYLQGQSFALEMKGDLDLKYIGALQAINEDKFEELILNKYLD